MAAGLARLGTVVREIREEEPEVIVVAPLQVPTTVRTAKVAAAALKAMEVDIIALDGEMPAESDAPARALVHAELPFVEPVDSDGEACRLHDSHVLERGGRRIALISLSASPVDSTNHTPAALRNARRAAGTPVASDWGPPGRAQELAANGHLDGVSAVLPVGVALAAPREPTRVRHVLTVPRNSTSGDVTVTTLRLARRAVEPVAQRVCRADRGCDPDGVVQDAVTRALASAHSAEEREIRSGHITGADVGYGLAHECGECHQEIYEAWKAHPHGRAMDTLREEGKAHEEECLQCHSEFYRRTGDLARAQLALGGVECASCHGDGLLHSLTARTDLVQREARRRTCTECHTEATSPQFRIAQYMERLPHCSQAGLQRR